MRVHSRRLPNTPMTACSAIKSALAWIGKTTNGRHIGKRPSPATSAKPTALRLAVGRNGRGIFSPPLSTPPPLATSPKTIFRFQREKDFRALDAFAGISLGLSDKRNRQNPVACAVGKRRLARRQMDDSQFARIERGIVRGLWQKRHRENSTAAGFVTLQCRKQHPRRFVFGGGVFFCKSRV